MPQNKNAAFRYRVIDQCLQNQHVKWTTDRLMEMISDRLREEFGITTGVSKRTLMYDLNVMRSDPPRGYAAPITCQDGCYSYTDPSFSILQRNLTIEDINVLHRSLDLLKQLEGIPYADILEGVIDRMECELFDQNQGYVILDQSIRKVQGTKWLGLLTHSIARSQMVQLKYHPFTEEEAYPVLSEPLFIREYNNRWFLIANNAQTKEVHNFALDRIQDAKALPDTFFRHPGIEYIKNFHNNVIGVTRQAGQDPQIIELFVSIESMHYLLTKPLHSSQSVINQNDAGMVISLMLVPNWELESAILALGEHVEVLSPASLRHTIAERAHKTWKQY